MRYIKEQQGYTLVLVLGIFVIFTILGFGMMTMTMQGAQKSDNRESMTQAQDLAVKGIDHLLVEIENKMMKENISGYGPLNKGLNAQDYLKKLEIVLDSYPCGTDDFSLTKTVTGTADYCILYHEPISSTNLYKKLVTFKSIGNSNNSNRTLVTEYEIGANVNYPNYSNVLTSIDNDKGDIDIHGGVTIKGNIYATDKLKISNNAYFKEANVPSVYPVIYSSTSGGSPLIRAQSINKVTSALQNNNLNPTPLTQMVSNPSTNRNFTFSNEQLSFTPINVGDVISSKKYDYTEDDIEKITTTADPFAENHAYLGPIGKDGGYSIATVNKLNSTDPKAYIEFSPNYSVPTLRDRKNTDWLITGNANFNSITFPRNLYLKFGTGVVSSNNAIAATINANNYAYIEKNLLIGLDFKGETSFNLESYLFTDVLKLFDTISKINLNTQATLNGVYYVNDSLYIQSAKLKGDAIIYVRNNAEIYFSEFDGNITIIAGGKIKIKYTSNNHNTYDRYFPDKPSNLTGLLYSNESIELEGASSLLNFNGIIAAPKIFISGTKGRAETSCNSFDSLVRASSNIWSTDYASNCYESAANQSLAKIHIRPNILSLLGILYLSIYEIEYDIKSRLNIEYSNYPNVQFSKLIKVDKMDKPIEINRK